MKDIVNKTTTPPQPGFVFTDPRTGIVHKDLSLFAIFPKVAKSWDANGIEPPENWKAVVIHEMCEQNPHIECREEGEVERHMTLNDVYRFASSVKKWMEGGMNFVSKEEAERRAAICASCHYNKPVGVCWGCHDALKWVGERIGWPETKRDSELRGCVKCGCVLRLKIHLPLDAIDNTGIEFPSHCWQSSNL
jgi:hypothetical protein